MRHIPYGAMLAGVAALGLWSCGGGGYGGSASTPTSPTASTPPASTPAPAPAPNPAPGASTVSVRIVGSTGRQAFSPNPITASAGQSVVFVNGDSTLHHIVIDGGPDLAEVTAGATSRGFAVANTNAVTFHCTIHPSMVGAINGAAPQPPMECVPDSYGYGC